MCLSGSCIVQYIHDHFRRQFKQPAAIGARPAQGNIEGRCQGARERQGRGTWGGGGAVCPFDAIHISASEARCDDDRVIVTMGTYNDGGMEQVALPWPAAQRSIM